jgi:hypothetical protein
MWAIVSAVARYWGIGSVAYAAWEIGAWSSSVSFPIAFAAWVAARESITIDRCVFAAG